MKVRSTGLGDTELVLTITGIKRKGDCLVVEGKSTAPVKWQIRMAASYIDLWQMAALVMAPRNLLFLIRKTFGFKGGDKIAWPTDF